MIIDMTEIDKLDRIEIIIKGPIQKNQKKIIKKPRTIEELLSSKDRVRIDEVYTPLQRELLAKLTKEEKKQKQCRKCGIYFHSTETCPYGKALCFQCYTFGHMTKDCTKEKPEKR